MPDEETKPHDITLPEHQQIHQTIAGETVEPAPTLTQVDVMPGAQQDTGQWAMHSSDDAFTHGTYSAPDAAAPDASAPDWTDPNTYAPETKDEGK